MNESLRGKLACVTGGGRGIGRFISRALVRAGATVAVTGRSRESLDATAAELGPACRGYVCDHRDPAAIDAVAAAIGDELGALDILVVNHAGFRGGPVTELSLEDWNLVIETNLTGYFWTCRAFLPGMVAKQRGDIVLISSMSGKKGDPGAAAYAASKFGLQGFAQSLCYEVRQHNIRVMVLNPSGVDKREGELPEHGAGLRLHAADLAATVVHLCALPGRTLVRDMDIWGTNP